MGHLIPLIEFAKRLVLRHDFSFTFFIPVLESQNSILQALPNSITAISIPPINFDDLPEDSGTETRISLTVTRSVPFLRDSLRALAKTTRLVAMVIDIFGTDAFDVALEFNMLPYIFLPSTAMGLCFIFHLPKLHETYSGEYRDLPEPIKLPGCVPVHGRDFPDALQDRKSEAYKWSIHHFKRFNMAHGILVNSFLEFEPGPFEVLMKEGSSLPPVYPVGPLIRAGEADGVAGSECLRWLDQQPRLSVLFVSFGSGGTLSHEQFNELAHGSEMSGQRFIWALKSPHEKSADASFFSAQSIKDPFDFLPEGFLDRTKKLGLMVPSWAPQAQILAHGSTGGFITHCGSGSILESIAGGVPLIAWPLFAEQKMIAVLLTEDLKVAIRVKPDENRLVGRYQITKHIVNLIEGEDGKRIRNKLVQLKDAAAGALSENGSSMNSFDKLAKIWSNHKN